jgi:hypothetical protein
VEGHSLSHGWQVSLLCECVIQVRACVQPHIGGACCALRVVSHCFSPALSFQQLVALFFAAACSLCSRSMTRRLRAWPTQILSCPLLVALFASCGLATPWIQQPKSCLVLHMSEWLLIQQPTSCLVLHMSEWLPQLGWHATAVRVLSGGMLHLGIPLAELRRAQWLS